jgi:glycosyltransferase involved in cell wall biosynthesis
MDEIAVLVPCYNEELSIAKVVRDFRAALPKFLWKIQSMVVPAFLKM